jgi:hypothetical protein
MAFTAGFDDGVVTSQGGFAAFEDARTWLTGQLAAIITEKLGGDRAQGYVGLAADSIASFPVSPFEFTAPNHTLYFIRQE